MAPRRSALGAFYEQPETSLLLSSPIFAHEAEITPAEAMKRERDAELEGIRVEQARRQEEAARQIMELYANQQPTSLEASIPAAQSIYAQHGDFDKALKLEDVMRNRRRDELQDLTSISGLSKYDPEVASQVYRKSGYDQKYGAFDPRKGDRISGPDAEFLRGLDIKAPEGTSYEALKASDEFLRARNESDKLKHSQDKYEGQISERAIPGFGFAPEGYPSADDAKIVKKRIAVTDRVNSLVNELEESVKKTGAFQYTGPEAQKQRQYASQVMLELKELANLGAALTGTEKSILMGVLPVLSQNPEANPFSVLMEQGLGRDPVQAMRNLRQIMNEGLETELRPRKYIRLPPQNNPNISSNPGITAPRIDGRAGSSEPITPENREARKQQMKEQIKARLRAERGLQ